LDYDEYVFLDEIGKNDLDSPNNLEEEMMIYPKPLVGFDTPNSMMLNSSVLTKASDNLKKSTSKQKSKKEKKTEKKAKKDSSVKKKSLPTVAFPTDSQCETDNEDPKNASAIKKAAIMPPV
jgi:hypothetical protein